MKNHQGKDEPMDFEPIVDIAKKHFKEMMDRITLFLTPPRNMENWFSGEMAVVLQKCKDEKTISEWRPEVRYGWNGEKGKKACDYVLQMEGNPPPLIGLEIKTVFAARQGKRQLKEDVDDGHLIVCDEAAGGGGALWKLQGSYYCNAVEKDAKRLSKEIGLSDRYCLVFAYGKNGELEDKDIEEFKNRLTDYLANNESVTVTLTREQTVLCILALRVNGAQDDVDNDR